MVKERAVGAGKTLTESITSIIITCRIKRKRQAELSLYQSKLVKRKHSIRILALWRWWKYLVCAGGGGGVGMLCRVRLHVGRFVRQRPLSLMPNLCRLSRIPKAFTSILGVPSAATATSATTPATATAASTTTTTASRIEAIVLLALVLSHASASNALTFA
jgi:hypothetical protein